MRRAVAMLLLAVLGLACGLARGAPAEDDGPPVLQLWMGQMRPVWTGVGTGGEVAAAGGGWEAVLRFPDGPQGWVNHGFRHENDGTVDWRPFGALALDVDLGGDAAVEVTAGLKIPEQPARLDYLPATKAVVVVRGAGVHHIVLPWNSFDFQQAQPAFLKFIKELRLSFKPAGEGNKIGAITLKNVRLVRAATIAVDAPVRGRAAQAGETVTYAARVANCTDAPQVVALSFERFGWEAMDASVEPPTLQLDAGAQADVIVRVKLGPKIPSGVTERQVLKAMGNGDAPTASTVTFITGCAVPHPYIMHTAQRWQEVRDRVKNLDWAKQAQSEYVRTADRWNVPEVARAPQNLTHVDNMGPFLFHTQVENDLMACGFAYQLTGDVKYAEKIHTFMLRLSNPADGYPITLRGCDQSLVQEGHFFQHIAMSYDMVLPSGLFSSAEQTQIEKTFRLLMETIQFESSYGAINNWNLSEDCGALYSALAIQDMALADRFYHGPAGILEQMGKGILDDGWWYECAIGYNVWCASEFTQVALAMEPWGYNLRDAHVPVSSVPNFSIIPWAFSNQYGQSFEKWGPITHNYVDIKRMWDALPAFTDYRGVIFGLNDAAESRLGGRRTEIAGQPFELAYYVFRDPAYATLIKQGGTQRDLLYGVPALPQNTPEAFRDSVYADNVGVVTLRSQTANRPIREQIQATLHYGTHGGYHGHFDRTDLLSLMRYGRSFYNPEMIWYGYASFMYKFYVQTSISHNMVVVDQKMQEPVESSRLLFHAGKMMQATALETNARWSNPPYGGMVYPEQGYKSLQEKLFAEGRSLPAPPKEPVYGDIGPYTDRVLQRRLAVVTDDYVLLADYLKGAQEHTFDQLLQIRGFTGIDGADVKRLRHDAQWNTDPAGNAQLVTDCQWYGLTAPGAAHFVTDFGADDRGSRTMPTSEPGLLKMDVHMLWPAQQELMVANAPDLQDVQKRLFWTVSGDGQILTQGKVGAWIIGTGDIDVPMEGVKELRLETRTEMDARPTIFWANARIVTADGKEVYLGDLPVRKENIRAAQQAGKDFAGGPITIAGEPVEKAVSGQPQDTKKPAVLTLPLADLHAVRFKATLGGDYPMGDEAQFRKTFAVRSRGKEARFLTVIEPYEAANVVMQARAIDGDHVEVLLRDGRTQTIEMRNLTGDGKSIGVTLSETKDGKMIRTESTAAAIH